VDLSIYSLSGQRIRTLAHGMHEVGRYHASWNGTNDDGALMKAGVYFLRLDAPGYRKSRTISLIR